MNRRRRPAYPRTAEGRVFQNVEWHRGGSSPGTSLLALAGFLGLCLLVGIAAGALTAGAVRPWYDALARPPGTPPDWVFPLVWTVLYLMIGTSAWLVWRRVGNAAPLRLWGWQLLVNALWTPAFFGLREPPLGAVVIVTLLALVIATVRAFDRVERRAALLMVPYAIWVAYAGYLNIGIWWLNPA